MNINGICELSKKLNCEFFLNEPMKRHTSFKIGGPADIFIRPDNIDKLKGIILYCKNNNIPYVFVGNGSNLLINDSGIRGAVINISSKMEFIKLEDQNKIICSSGTSMAKLSHFAMENSLSGLEFLWGIPGNVGGGVFMNAGAYGDEIKNFIVSSKYIDDDGNIGEYNKDDMKLGYRRSVYAENGYCIIEARFIAKNKDKIDIQKKMDELLKRRKEKQPLEYPNCGSIFKRPEGNYAGTLIEKSGLKGRTFGGAKVSEKHAGFIINVDNATCYDVLKLIEIIKVEVFEKTGYNLESEVRVI